MTIHRISAVERGVVGLQKLQLAPPGPDEVQVRLSYSVVSPGTERAFTLDLPNTGGSYPRALGYSSSGIVMSVGDGVTAFRPGDRVAGSLGHQSIGNLPQHLLTPVPDGVDMEDAAFLHVVNIAMQGVRHARIEMGEAVVVVGCGLIGQLASQMAKASGAYPLLCVDKSQRKLAIADTCGADTVLVAEDGWPDKVRELTDNRGAPVVIEATGFGDPVVDALKAAADYGRIILLGSTRTPEVEINLYEEVLKTAVSVIGAHVDLNPAMESRPGFWTWTDQYRVIMAMLQAKRLQTGPLITHRLPCTAWKEIYGHVLQWDEAFVTCLIEWKDM